MEQEQHTISEKIIKQLEHDQVTPIARWHFVVKNSTFWTLWAVAVVVGACATAASIFVFKNADWHYYSITHETFSRFFFDVMPLFWLVSFIVMVVCGYYTIRHTTRGYRFSFYLVVLASIFGSLIGGVGLFALGVGKDIDDIRGPLPFSSPLLFVEEGRWDNVERGLLSGRVESFNQNKAILVLRRYSGDETFISTEELVDSDTTQLKEGAHIRVIVAGTTEINGIIVACAVLPWDIHGVALPPQGAMISPYGESERNINMHRTNLCKDVQPYQRYKQTFITR